MYSNTRNVRVSPETMQNRETLKQNTAESVDHLLWASAQGLALSKLQTFSAMAKHINDQ